MEPSPQQCAAELVETVPLLMRVIRANVRSHRGPEMSIPQFRTMAFIGRNKGAALSDLAAFLGLTLPSTSKLVDGLVSTKLATRKTHAEDRRCVVLALTSAGEKRHDAARKTARDFFAQKLCALSNAEQNQILRATRTLKKIFSDPELPQASGVSRRNNGAKQVRAAKK
jgi:DNA-binding MarR family transcriptional regulator